MLRVASVIPSLAVQCGGPIINLVESVPHLRDAGVDLTIFTTDMGAPASATHRRATPADFPDGSDQCDIRMYRAEHPRRLAYSPDLRKALREATPEFDLLRVHGLYLHPHYSAATEANRRGVPYVITLHGALDPWIRRHGRFRKALIGATWQNGMIRRAAAVHTTTEAEATLLDGVVPSSLHRRVVGNGVDTEQYRHLPPQGVFRAELGIDADVSLVLFLGRIAEKKGVDILLKAVAAAQRRDLALAVVGPDDEALTSGLRRLAVSLGIADVVHFTGPRYDKDRLSALADADLWVLPSHSENFGNAVVEAMAAGLPTIVSPAVNLAPEILAANAGRVVAAEPECLSREIVALLDDPDERKRLAVAAPEYAARYAWPGVSKRLAAMFREFAP